MPTTPEESDATLDKALDKLLLYCLQPAVAKFKELADKVRAASEVCNFQRRAYQGAPKDAIRTELVIGEEEQWVGDRDSPLQPFRGQKPDGTVQVIKMPILAGDRALREASSHFANHCSRITTAIRQVRQLYPGLIEPASALACVCENETRWKKDVPEWATKGSPQVPEDWDDEHAGFYRLESGDMAVRRYWPVLEPELIQLVAAIERRGQDTDGGSAAKVERWYPSSWYSKQTEQGLYPDLLWRASNDGRVKSRKVGGRRQYELESVCKVYSEYREQLEAGASKANQSQPKPTLDR